jgi:macrophage erythroblast attacher
VEGVVKGVRAAAAQAPLTREAAVQQLDGFAAALQGIKRKVRARRRPPATQQTAPPPLVRPRVLRTARRPDPRPPRLPPPPARAQLDEASVAERGDAHRVRARLEHLRALGAPGRDGQVDWTRPRMPRLLVDHMLRCGYAQSAARLARAAGAEELTELHLFAAAAGVSAGLAARDCAPALAWCAAHRARLQKARSPLEFRLRVQEFVELARAGRAGEALAHARRHLAPAAAQHGPELRRAAGALAFRPDTRCAPYAELYDEARWRDLEALFRKELYRLHALPPASLLQVHLQAGLSALKTPQSLAEGCGRQDPLHLPAFRALAEGLPAAKHSHSKLLCALSGRAITEDNPPMVLPNGWVYGEAALRKLAEEGGGRVTCPRTGAVFEFAQLRRAFVL